MEMNADDSAGMMVLCSFCRAEQTEFMVLMTPENLHTSVLDLLTTAAFVQVFTASQEEEFVGSGPVLHFCLGYGL